MIVADYARKADETTHECLSGYYFRKLSQYLLDCDFNVNNTYRTCIIKMYEKGLGVGTWGQDRKMLTLLHETYGLLPSFFTNILLNEINTTQPTVILAMGEYALQTLTGKSGITNFRGSVLPLRADLKANLKCPSPKIVISQHLAIEHTQEEQKFLLRSDIAKAVDLVHHPELPLDTHEIVICRNVNDWLRFREPYGENPERMVTDIETHFGFITCASVSYDGFRGAVIPGVGSKVDQMEKCRLNYFLAKDLENERITKGNQNIGYDKRIYQRFGYRVKSIKWDTMLAASVIAAEFPKRLGFLTSIYCDGAYHKDEGKEFDPSKHSYDQLYEYCAKDSIKTFQIWDKQLIDLDELCALPFFEDFMMPLFDVYFDLDSVGILQDQGKKRQLLGKYEGLYNLKELELRALTGIVINLNSPSQIGKYMEENGFPVLRHRVDTGYMAVNTDVESMKKMRSASPNDYKKCSLPYEHAIRFINLILLIRRIDKVLEYIEVGVHPDGRIRTGANLGGTSSGRTSGRQTPDQIFAWGFDKKERRILESEQLGCSLQTVTKHGFIIEGDDDEEIEDGIIGKDVREMYIPDPGMVIVEIDRSNAEGCIVNVLSEDWQALEERGKIDGHCKNAALIFTDYSYDQIRKLYKAGDPDGVFMRQIGKKGVHATNYDMGDYRFSNLANISIKLAHEVLQKIHQAKPWIKEVYHASVEQAVRDHRRLDNPVGRPRMFYKKIDAHGIKVAYSWYPQSTISDTTKLAMLKLSSSIDKTKAWIVAENHDSITALVKLGYLRTYVSLAKKFLEEPIDFRNGTFYRDYELVIPCEVSIGRKNWGQMKEMRKLRLVA